MSKQFNKGVVIHTRDLRIYDNRTIKKAYEECEDLLHIFVLFDYQLSAQPRIFPLNTHAIQFMHESLIDLQHQLQEQHSELVILKDSSFSNALDELYKKFEFESIYISKDFSPTALKREEELQQYCLKHNINYTHIEEHILIEDSSKYLKPTDNKAYTIYTPFYKNAIKYEVPEPLKYDFKSLVSSKQISKELITQTQKNIQYLDSLYEYNDKLIVKGGRSEAWKHIQHIDKFNYKEKRDIPSIKGTTRLSAHHKFGTISQRESFYALQDIFKEYADSLLNELYWHDFYLMIAKHFPHVFEHAFQTHYDNIDWINDTNNEHFKAWCDGETGFPIIDAGMRELNETGYMHNRVRMIVASFLTKDLHIHWRLGEEYFAHKLTDYDSAVNNGSWQWAASTGCDAQPYFRIFNPWLQQKRFDPQCEYIKTWVSELKNLEPKAIHNLEEQRPLFMDKNYPKPIVNHKEQKEIALKMFKGE
ncbi:MAG: cryptochrome/photolyase family protein [Candidatus Nanoarchaeia archaeon]